MAELDKNTYFDSSRFNRDILKLKLNFNEDTKTVYGEYIADEKFESAPNIIHAGIIATIMDEAMLSVNKHMNVITITAELIIRYLNTAFINENIYIRGWYEKKKSKNVIMNRADIENESGRIIARSKGTYVEVKDIPQPECLKEEIKSK
jgi:acyl-coenzyme A thioesterase PaaI-like protein